jgi:hypothetical protein
MGKREVEDTKKEMLQESGAKSGANTAVIDGCRASLTPRESPRVHHEVLAREFLQSSYYMIDLGWWRTQCDTPVEG